MKQRSRIKTIPVHLTTFDTIRALVPCGHLWTPIGPLGAFWVTLAHFGPFGLVWLPLGRLVLIWDPWGSCWDLFGYLWASVCPFDTVWASLGNFWFPWAPYGSLLSPSGILVAPIWATLGPSVPLGTFGFIGGAGWSSWALLCYLWPPLVYLDAMWSPLGHF